MNNAPNNKRRVSFDMVDILEFKQVVGDNPCVSTGVPVALAPNLERRTSVDLEIYEGTRRPRRNLIGLTMSGRDRERMYVIIGHRDPVVKGFHSDHFFFISCRLLKNGVDKEEIKKATNQANSVKFNREQSFHR